MLKRYNYIFVCTILILAVLSMLAGGCAQAPLDYPRKTSFALANPQGTLIGKQIRPQETAHPEESGFRLLSSGLDAFVAKAVFINAAQRTLDAQVFIFEDDLIGNLIVDRMFDAADRGVRVRLLVDDWEQAGKDWRLAGIAAHPNIEVRLFNPAGGLRWWPFLRQSQYVFGPKRIWHRMHNKALIIDNTIAFVGGRNIADEYFTARDDLNYRDLDLMAVGPVAQQVSASFDGYWNDRLAVPIQAFVADKRAASYLKDVRRKIKKNQDSPQESQYIQRLAKSNLISQAEANNPPLFWSPCRYVSDPPAKIVAPVGDKSFGTVVSKVDALIESSSRELLVTTPYLVPNEAAMQKFKQMHDRGVAVKILTNSLASIDHPSAYGGYESCRKRLLRDGAELYEIKPVPRPHGRDRDDFFRAMLHTKCYIADRSEVFIGSFNLDRRSASLDTEDGIIVESKDLAGEAAKLFDKGISANYSYRLILDPESGRLVWLETIEGRTIRYYSEPNAGLGRHFEAWFLSSIAPEEWL